MSTILPTQTAPVREDPRDPDGPAGGRAAATALRVLLSRTALSPVDFWRDTPPRESEIEAALLRAATGA